ncbi:MAG: conserved exported protein of unknown function [Nitrospira sp.]|nr:MAG: conserved exported protein of unknown function [Nitrospira sp.]
MNWKTVVGMALCVGVFTTAIALAHSERAIRDAFPQGPIPEEVAEATRELASTAGMNALRADAHAKQHRLLEQYLKAGWRRTCEDSQALLPGLDDAIRVARDSAHVEEEADLRRKRDDVAAIIVDSCAESSADLPSRP